MKFLIVTATKGELDEESLGLDFHRISDHLYQCHLDELELYWLVTGVGMVPMTFCLTRQLMASQYDLIINAGIAGSFKAENEIGDVVCVTSETFSELGAATTRGFLTLSMLGLETDPIIKKETVTAPIPLLLPEFKRWPQKRGITVNTILGSPQLIASVESRLHPDLESMEGGAFLYVCRRFNLPCIQLRGISNYVEERNKDFWNIPLAVKNLSLSIKEILNRLC